VLNPYAGLPSTTASSPVYQASAALVSPFGSPPKIAGVVNMIFAQAASSTGVAVAQEQMQAILHRRHRIGPSQDDDFTVRNLNDIAQASESASRVQILLQFLVEAILLSVLGGLAGIALGVIASKLISALAGWPVLVSPLAVGGGFMFSALIGIFFGYYPASKASMLDPIEALRYE
jgi:macrolide transport system ATP-binding/permease protein